MGPSKPIADVILQQVLAKVRTLSSFVALVENACAKDDGALISSLKLEPRTEIERRVITEW